MHAADGTPAAWHADRHLIVTAPARTGGSTLLTRLLDPGDAYVNVASSHIPPIPDGIRFAGRDDLDGALAAVDAQPARIAVDGMEYWLRGLDEPIANPRNNPRVAAWNEAMRDAAHRRALFRDRLRRASEQGARLILLFRTPDADTLLGRWPCGVTPTRCDRIELERPRDGRAPATFTPAGRAPIRCERG